MNLIAWLEFELTYYDIAVQYVSHGDFPSNKFGFCVSTIIMIVINEV